MFETLRRHLTLAEQAWNEHRVPDALEALQQVQHQAIAQAKAWVEDLCRDLASQIDKLAEIGLVVSDLDAELARIRSSTEPTRAAKSLEQIQRQIQDMVDPAGKLLLRTNIFDRGKKTFLSFEPDETLGQVASRLKARYRDQIVAHFARRGVQVAVPEALDIVFFGPLVWERPDEAVLSEHERVADIVAAEPEGLIWLPVLPGDATSLLGLEDDEASAVSILENFTVDTDLDRLEDDMRQVAERLDASQGAGVEASSPSDKRHAVLIKGRGTPKEERIPLIGNTISLGRGRNTDIQIVNDARVSRHHCNIVHQGDTFYIEDNASSNGTLVNGERVQRVKLEGGETIGVGDTEFLFLLM